MNLRSIRRKFLKGDKQGHSFHGNQYTRRGAGAATLGHERVVSFNDGVKGIVSDPVPELEAKHGVHKDWSTVTCVDPKKRARIADFYDKAEDVPADKASPEVKRAYAALAKEVDQQYKMLTGELGVKVEFTDEDPYANYSEMYKDFVTNKRLKILKTSSTGSHPLLTDEQNDRLRAVHDAFGHLGTGRGFDRHGEEAAYQAHRSMFSPEAQKAAATELRGQNSFLIEKGYFGPQKLVIMPEELRKRLVALLEKMEKDGDVQQHNDDDNAYETTGSHHVSCGRVTKRVEKSDTFNPPAGVRAAARRALRLIADGHAGGGFTDVGRKRASDLAAGRSVSLDTVKRMHSYFSRHEVDKQGKDWNNTENPSPGKVAWLAWGGDAGKSWAASIVSRMEKGDSVGHPFRGNQYAHPGALGGVAVRSSAFKQKKKTATPVAEPLPDRSPAPVMIDADDDTMLTHEHLIHNIGLVNAEELSDSTGIPVRRTKDILNRLAKHGFAHKTKVGRVDHFFPAKRVHVAGKVAVGIRRANGGNWMTHAHQERINERRDSLRSSGIGGRRG